MVALDTEVMAPADQGNEPFQLWCLQRFGVMTARTVEVVVMRDKWLGELIADFPTDMDGVNDVELVKGFENAIDAGAVSVRRWSVVRR